MTNAVALAQGASNNVTFRNRIINGAMGIWQRGTTLTSSSYVYLTDRWANGVWGTNTQASQSTSVPSAGFQYSLKMQRPSGATSTGIIGTIQTIESVNCYDLSSQTVTLSFWAKAGANYSSAGNAFGVQISTGTTADQGGNTYGSWTGLNQQSTTKTLTTSWQQFTYTLTFGAGVLESAIVFYYVPVGTAGADDSFFITGVQLEAGSTASPFEYRQYGTEFSLCQRYLPAFTRGSSNLYVGAGWIYNTTNAAIYVPFNTSVRTNPTGVTWTGSASIDSTVSAAAGAITIITAGLSGTTVNATGSGMTAGQACGLVLNNSTGQLLFTGCEL